MKYNNKYKIDSKQRGMSLIELMISMVVGLFLLAGVITNFISTTTADLKRQAVSEMDANAGYAISILRQTISHAGYKSINNVRLEKPFYTPSDGNIDNPSCGGEIVRDTTPLTKERNATSGNNYADKLTVITLADNPCQPGLSACPDPSDMNTSALVYTDCIGGGATRDSQTVSCSTDPSVGMTDPTQARIYSGFRLVRNGNNARTLYCDGNRGGTQPIAENVEAIQFLYGVKRDDGTTVYRAASDVENSNQWGLVRSVQLGLLMRSSNQFVLDKISNKKEYAVLNGKVIIADKDLRRLFRVYTTTINLENLNKGALL